MKRLSGEERRKRLIDEATRSFGTVGYDATSLEGIAGAVGVTKQTLLYYFPTKQDLFNACIDEAALKVGAALERGLEGHERGWSRIESVIHSVFEMATEHPELPLLAREGARRDPDVVQRFADRLEPLRKRALAFLEQGMVDGVFRKQDPVLLLFTLYTAVVGSLTEAGVLRVVSGGQSGTTALREREKELISFMRRALEP